jgi:hypothetical protein
MEKIVLATLMIQSALIWVMIEEEGLHVRLVPAQILLVADVAAAEAVTVAVAVVVTVVVAEGEDETAVDWIDWLIGWACPVGSVVAVEG